MLVQMLPEELLAIDGTREDHQNDANISKP